MKLKNSQSHPRRYLVASITVMICLALLTIYGVLTIDTRKYTLQRVHSRLCRIVPDNKPSTSSNETLIAKIFEPNESLEDISPANDENWLHATSTKTGGALWVKHNQTHQEAWGVSMFHALHCMQMIRVGLRNKHLHDATAPLRHLDHCVGYIAQHLLCAGDSTLEAPWVIRNEAGEIINMGVSGEGYKHQCRDLSFLWRTVMRSEESPMDAWEWQPFDTVESVFGSGSKD